MFEYWSICPAWLARYNLVQAAFETVPRQLLIWEGKSCFERERISRQLLSVHPARTVVLVLA